MDQQEPAEDEVELALRQAGLVCAPFREGDVVEAARSHPRPCQCDLVGAHVDPRDPAGRADALTKQARHASSAAPDVGDAPAFADALGCQHALGRQSVHIVQELQPTGTLLASRKDIVVADLTPR